MNTVPSFNKYVRRLQALFYAIRYPRAFKSVLQNSVDFLYHEGVSKKAKIEQKPLSSLMNVNIPILLQNFSLREGNVSSLELLVLSLLVANRKPKNLLEIGTFDGTSTLQMALNSPADSIVQTIDLPSNGDYNTYLSILEEDVKYIRDQDKLIRKYVGSSVESKIKQYFGDSTVYDFVKFTNLGLIDFCFIDGGHSYECVKSDTENVFRIMKPNGMIVWHDFTPNCPGVYRYLSELSERRKLIHIPETHLVVLDKNS